MIIYLDESGDLGWTFTSPYRSGGSSRHLTISSLVVPESSDHLPRRLIRKLYPRFNWPADVEKKWSNMRPAERIYFAQAAKSLKDKYPKDIKYLSISVNKQNVQTHIRSDANKLYNYMIGLSLLHEMSKQDKVTFVPDPRSIKVESGNSLHDYLQTDLWFRKNAATVLKTQPRDSASCLNVQFADMLSGIVQGHFEDGYSEPWNQIKNHIYCRTLFF